MKLKKFFSTITALALILSSLSLQSFAADKEPTPNVQFVPTNEDELLITNVTPDLKVSFNDAPYVDLADPNHQYDPAENTVKIGAVTVGMKVSIIKPGTPPTTTDSDPVIFIGAQENEPDIQPSQKVAPQSVSNDDGKITGLDDSYEYKLATASEYTQIQAGETEITGLTGGTAYHIRKKATATTFASFAVVVTLDNYQAPPPPAPDPTEVKVYGKTNLVFELQNVNERIYFSTTGINGPFGRGSLTQTAWQSSVNDIVDGGIYVYRAGEPGVSSNSNKILLPLVRPEAPVTKSQSNPNGIEAHRATTAANNDGKITGIPAGVEYMNVDATNEVYIPVTGDTLENLPAPSSYYLRFKGDEGKLASPSLIVNILPYATPEDTPTTSFVATGYDKGTLSGLSNGLKYSIDGGNSYRDIPNGRTSIELTNVNPTDDIRVIKKATNVLTKLDSDPQVIDVQRAADPTNLAKTNPTTIANNDGTISGVTADMEYKTSAEANFRPITAVTLVNLSPGTYEIRTKANGLNLASEIETMVLDPFGGTVEATPNATFVATGYDTGTLSGLSAGMKYSVDSEANYVDHTTSDTSVDLTGLEAGKEIKVIKKGNGTTTIDSAVQAIPVTRQSEPTGFTKTDATVAANNNGKIEGLTTALEYRKLPATAWENVTGTSLENLEPATYELRTKATGTALTSESVSVEIAPYVAPSNYEISLSQTTDLVFQQKDTGYTAVTPETITITNTGDVATGLLNVELTGTNANDFELSAPTVADIAQSGTATFTVKPKLGLGLGDYVATVKVSNANVAEKTFVVKFKVVIPGTPLPVGLTGTINISGEYKFGKTLTANLVNSNNTGTLSYKWLEGSNELATTQSYTLTANEIGKVLTVVVESSAQTGEVTFVTPRIERADQPQVPSTTITVTQPTTNANNDAKISGVDDTMEYKKSTDTTWTPVPSGATVLENLANGQYEIRKKETPTHAAGPITTFTILAHGVTPSPGGGGGGGTSGGSSSSTPAPAKTPTTTTALKEGDFKLKIGSKIAEIVKEGKTVQVTMDAAPFIQNGRTMVPLRYVAELLGLKVEWLPATKTAKLTAEKVEILVPINKTTMMVNGKAVESDQMPILKENRTYLSISNIAKALGLEEGKNIIWDNNAKEVLVKK